MYIRHCIYFIRQGWTALSLASPPKPARFGIPETHKPPHHDKVAVHEGVETNNFIFTKHIYINFMIVLTYIGLTLYSNKRRKSNQQIPYRRPTQQDEVFISLL